VFEHLNQQAAVTVTRFLRVSNQWKQGNVFVLTSNIPEDTC
jgi:hypothetical protein